MKKDLQGREDKLWGGGNGPDKRTRKHGEVGKGEPRAIRERRFTLVVWEKNNFGEIKH